MLVFLENVSITVIDKTDSQNREKEKIIGPHFNNYGTLLLKYS